MSKTYWDKISFVYDIVMNKDKKAYEIIINKIKKSLSFKEDVLEIGCGTGKTSKQIANLCNKLIVSDYSENMIAHAKKNLSAYQNVEVRKEDVFDLSFKENSFDFIIMINVLHIITNQEKALKEVNRVLKKDGKLICVSYVYTDNLVGKFYQWLLGFSGCKNQCKWKGNEFINILIENDFVVLEKQLIKSTVDMVYVVLEKN